MTIIGLDLGRRRIGVAVATTISANAQPLTVIERRSRPYVLEMLRAVIREWQADGLVIGLPLNMDGSEGPGTVFARKFAAELADQLGLSVELQDERLSSFEARQALMQSARGREARRISEDSIAAALIVERWLQTRGAVSDSGLSAGAARAAGAVRRNAPT